MQALQRGTRTKKVLGREGGVMAKTKTSERADALGVIRDEVRALWCWLSQRHAVRVFYVTDSSRMIERCVLCGKMWRLS